MTETQPFENLKEVPRKFSPVPIWWWSGDEVTEERLKFQMEQMVEGGIYNAMIMNVAPNAPLFGKDMDNPNYMSDRWWELFEFTCQTAKELGIYIWFYDQIGFSGANFQARVAKLDPAYQGQKLSTSSLIVDGVQRLSPPEDATLLAAYARSIDAAEQPLGEYELLEIEDGKAVTPSGRYQVMLVFSLREGFNYFSREACDLLLDKVHGEFDRHSSQWFGDVIVGSFQDELPALSVWGDTFAESFKAMKGYDLIPLLVDLFEGASKRAKRTRRDYQDVRAKLAEEAFFKPFYQWHEDRGLVCGIDQSGLARGGHTIDAVYYYADYIRTQRWYAIPGSDLMGNAKIHASIADQYNRHRVWIESFHSSGWGGTLEETFDWLLPWYRDGANLYDPHAFYYSTKGGFWEWAPPSTCWRQPYWKHYKQFADATTRMSYMLTGGTHVSDIAVLYPTSSAQSLYKLGMSGGFGAINELDENATEAHKLQSVYEEITGNLNFYGARKNGILAENQRDYEIINESTLAEEAQIRDGAVTFNNSRFHTVILPNLTVLTEPAARALVEFVHQGGNLIAVASLPENVDPDAQETFDQLHALFNDGKGTFIDTGDALKPLLDQLPNRVLEAPVATLHRKKGQQNILFVPATKIEATEDYHGGMMAPDQTTYNFSADHYLRDLKLTIHDRVDVYQMNLITGDVAPAVFNQLNSSTEVRLSFEDAPAVILLWEDGSSGKVEPQSNTPLELVATLPDQWRYTMIDTMQNRYGDFTKPNFEGAPAPATWFFRHHADADGTFDGIHADPSDWQTVQATFGQQAWSLTAPLAQLPGPAQTMDAYALIESVENWSPVVYSKTRGIAKDQLHSITLGPSGHIPEEFMSFGEVPAGSGVQVRTAIWSD
ncbi:MAG: hypothetical protein JW750_09915, partial [Anaerolineaceae bacterium]|nr:hypothetical protein [Anaerolineaceae bacterium]